MYRPSKALNLFQNNCVNSSSLLFMSLQFKFSVHPCDVCIILVFPPHLFAYLLTCLLQVKFASNNSRQLDFPRRFELSGGDCMSLLFNGFFNSTRCRCLGLIAVSILFTLSYITSVITFIYGKRLTMIMPKYVTLFLLRFILRTKNIHTRDFKMLLQTSENTHVTVVGLAKSMTDSETSNP